MPTKKDIKEGVSDILRAYSDHPDMLSEGFLTAILDAVYENGFEEGFEEGYDTCKADYDG